MVLHVTAYFLRRSLLVLIVSLNSIISLFQLADLHDRTFILIKVCQIRFKSAAVKAEALQGQQQRRHDARRHAVGPCHVTGIARKPVHQKDPAEMDRPIISTVFALLCLLSGKLTLYCIFQMYGVLFSRVGVFLALV